MKLSPFTLVYQPAREARVLSSRRAATGVQGVGRVSELDARPEAVRELAPDLAGALNSFDPNLARTLIASTYAHESAAPDDPVEEKLWRVVTDMRRAEKVVTVAVWDLDARVGGLGRLVNALNEAQPVFTFFDLQAPLPAGLVISSEGFAEWARKRLEKRVSKSQREGFTDNFMFDDFNKFARVVHKQVGTDYLVGITRHMVAWTQGESVYWNYFTASDRRVILTSAYNLREYAALAGRPFEAAVAGLVVAEILAALNRRLGYHEENRGCLFDFNQERDTVIESIRQARIEPQCLDLIDEKYRDAAAALTDVLRNYSPPQPDEVPTEKSAKKKAGQDDEYWLAQLTKLSKKTK
ncbi:MAG TPA: hypothetical protein VF240_02355 [Pyrinomonadaceae bacterium]